MFKTMAPVNETQKTMEEERRIFPHAHCKKERIIMEHDGGVSYCYSGNRIAIYKCIKSWWLSYYNIEMYQIDVYTLNL